MDLIDTISIIISLGLGIITSYEDIKENKIRNKWVGPAILIAIILFIIRIILIKFSGSQVAPGYIKEYLFNSVITFAVGFMIWELKLWNAADAKLFLAYAMLIPFKFYYKGYMNRFPSFVLLTNTFLPYLVFGFSYSLFKIKKSDFKKIFRRIIRQTSTSLFLLVGLFWMSSKFLSLIPIPILSNLNMIFTVVIMVIFQKYLKIKLNYLGIGLTILALIFDIKYFDLKLLVQLLKTLFLYMFVRFFILSTGFKIFTKRVRIADLKPGMVLADEILKKDEEYIANEKILISITQAFFQKASYEKLIKNKPEGISKQDIKKIQTQRKLNKLKSYSLNIAKTVAFAPFLLFGVILTLLSKGSVLTFLYILIEKFI
ncbi:MAG: hypothetical protein MAG795_00490 [Candidatus Woesearchaeota archaeon]|nr:hypothetical protein [Candidatus Woesearchaeota archaeon]